jgi:biotin carboxyl carrier protein
MPRTFIATIEGAAYELPEPRIRAELSGPEGAVKSLPSAPGTDLLEVRHQNRQARVYARTLSDGTKEIWIDRYRVVVDLQDERQKRFSGFVKSARGGPSGSSVRAPMPGLIKEIAVGEGDAVKRGQRLLILEAMKMENEIASPVDGVVAKCRLTPGVNVEKDQELLTITPTP